MTLYSGSCDMHIAVQERRKMNRNGEAGKTYLSAKHAI